MTSAQGWVLWRLWTAHAVMFLSVGICVKGGGVVVGEWGLTHVTLHGFSCLCLCSLLTVPEQCVVCVVYYPCCAPRGSSHVRHANKPAQKQGLCPSSYCRRGSASRAWRTSCRRPRKGARACKAVSMVRVCIRERRSRLHLCSACQQTPSQGTNASYVALAVTCLASLSCVCACACAGSAMQVELEEKSSTPCSSCSTLQAQLEVRVPIRVLFTCSLPPPPKKKSTHPHCVISAA